jgi:uncharacterized coiled-coil DUF342 family protein
MMHALDPDELQAAGFEALDDHLIERSHPPKIKWGLLYQGKSADHKIAYLEKICAAMNHAAALVQGERDELATLCALKEQQLTSLAASVRANNDMLQQEVTTMNAQRQGYHEEVSRLTAEIKSLRRDV